VLLLLFQPLAYGQAATYARLVGTVRDQTGAVIPGVEVTATARATNVLSLALSNDRGDYLIDKLIPGRYDIKAALVGFTTQVSLDVRLKVTQVARVDFTLAPGEITELVTGIDLAAWQIRIANGFVYWVLDLENVEDEGNYRLGFSHNVFGLQQYSGGHWQQAIL